MHTSQIIIDRKLLDMYFSVTRNSMPRVSSGYFALLNSNAVQLLCQSYPSVFNGKDIASIQKNINSCWFIISEQGKQPNKTHYLAIIDDAVYQNPRVGQRTWTAGHNRGKHYKYYMHGDGVPLHQRIDKLLNIPLSRTSTGSGPTGAIHIHHTNYCAFDNRRKNLVKLYAKAHREQHKGIKISKSVEIKDEEMLARFIVIFFSSEC